MHALHAVCSPEAIISISLGSLTRERVGQRFLDPEMFSHAGQLKSAPTIRLCVSSKAGRTTTWKKTRFTQSTASLNNSMSLSV
jgi:hypothetical protein